MKKNPKAGPSLVLPRVNDRPVSPARSRKAITSSPRCAFLTQPDVFEETEPVTYADVCAPGGGKLAIAAPAPGPTRRTYCRPRTYPEPWHVLTLKSDSSRRLQPAGTPATPDAPAPSRTLSSPCARLRLKLNGYHDGSVGRPGSSLDAPNRLRLAAAGILLPAMSSSFHAGTACLQTAYASHGQL